jgi:hypothetical protein
MASISSGLFAASQFMAHAKPRAATANDNERDMKQDFDIDIATPFQR